MAKLRFSSTQFRALPSPSGTGKVGLFFARAASISPDLRDWRAVNPRDVKRAALFKAIKETLVETPARFAERNRGLTISASEVEFDDKRREVIVTLEDFETHGLVDGGHTLEAILEAQADPDREDEELTAEVFVKVMTGIAPDQITEIAGGLNTSQQVDLRSLANLDHLFDPLKKILDGEPYGNNIAYKMNEPKDIDVREVLYYLAVFDCDAYDDVRHPQSLFGRKEGIVRDFARQAEKGGGSFDKLITRAPDILKLRDKIEKRTLKIEGIGRYKADRKSKVKSPKHKKNPLHFLNDTVDGKVSLGWIMPMLGAFRANVIWGDPKGSFSWRVPIDELLDASIEGLVTGVMEIHDRENARPEYVGRNATAWRICYERVQNAILSNELKRMRQE